MSDFDRLTDLFDKNDGRSKSDHDIESKHDCRETKDSSVRDEPGYSNPNQGEGKPSFEEEIQREYESAFKYIIKNGNEYKKGSFIILTKRKFGGIIAACLVLSLVFGITGGLISKSELIGKNADEKKVIYQAVETNFEGKSSGDISLTVSDINELVSDSVVEITTEQVLMGFRLSQYISKGAGSGVIISDTGYIVTNSHVIEGATKITVTLKNGEKYEAALIGSDSKTDIAIIKIDAKNIQPAIFGDSDSLKVGSFVVAIGNPLGSLGGTVTDGIISALDREISIDNQTMRLLQTNAAVNPGNSGGGLFDGKAQLIGIVNAKSSGSGVEGLGFAIPINAAKPIIDDLMSKGYVSGRVELGVNIVEIDSVQKAISYGVQKYGVYITNVGDPSAAKTAGLLEGDYIVSADGHVVSRGDDIRSAMDAHSVGDEMTLIIERDGKTLEITVTLGEYTPLASS